MSTLLVMKEQLQVLYAKYSTYITIGMRLILGLLVFGLINSNIGFMKAASSGLCTVGLAAVCAFLPTIVMVLAATALILLHLYSLSMVIAIVAVMYFFVMYIFYFRFTSRLAWLALLTAVGFALKVPFAVVVGIGLLGTPVCLIPAVCGAFTYYMVHFVKMSSSTFKDGSANSMVEGLMSFTKQTLANKEMWVMIAAVIFCVLVVYSVRTRALDHAWKIASVAGTAAAVVVCVAGNVVLNTHISYVVLLVGGTAAIAVGLILEVLFLAVDYSRTEHLEFEDDEYHYYVKAVPKVGVTLPEKQVKHITEPHEEQPKEAKAAVNLKPEPMVQETVAIDTSQIQEADLEKNVDELLLTQSLNEELRQNQNEPEDDLSLTKSLGDLWTKKPGSGE